LTHSSEWTELILTDDDLIVMSMQSKKIRIIADENVPRNVIEELQSARLRITSIKEKMLRGIQDDQVVQFAAKNKLVLLTSDMDYWDERKHPINKCFGIIVIGYGPEQSGDLIDSLSFFYELFMKYYPHEWWGKTKALIKVNSFRIRLLNWEGKIQEDEYKDENGKLLTRRIR